MLANPVQLGVNFRYVHFELTTGFIVIFANLVMFILVLNSRSSSILGNGNDLVSLGRNNFSDESDLIKYMISYLNNGIQFMDFILYFENKKISLYNFQRSHVL